MFGYFAMDYLVSFLVTRKRELVALLYFYFLCIVTVCVLWPYLVVA